MITKDGQEAELAHRPRHLGQRGELLILTRGPGSNWLLFTSIGLAILALTGMHDSLVDTFGLFKASGQTAKVTYVDETNFYINDEPVYEIGFSYEQNGVASNGFCYSRRPPTEGRYVNLLQSSFSPKVVKLEGTKYGMWGIFGTIILGCLGVCLFFGLLGFRKGSRWRKLLRNGISSVAELKEMIPTSTQINDQPVYRLKWTFLQDRGRLQDHEFRTHRIESYAIGDRVPLLYEEGNAENSLLIKNIPEGLWLDRPGEWVVMDDRLKGIYIKLGITLFCFAYFAHKLILPFV